MSTNYLRLYPSGRQPSINVLYHTHYTLFFSRAVNC